MRKHIFPMNNNKSRPHLFGLLAGVFLSAGLCLATVIATRAWMKISESQEISVTGSARKEVRSDLAVWTLYVYSESGSLADARARSKLDLAEVEAFLRGAGQREYVLKPIEARPRHVTTKLPDGSQTQRIAAYGIQQNMEVRVENPDVVAQLASDASKLIDKGVLVETTGIRYIYTKAGEAKIEMMGEAAKDARVRADQIAAQGGRKIRELRSARMGVVQINPRYSTATSWEGNNDVTSLEKTITTTVTAVFSLQ